ncbi:MAG: hypothetical protein U0V72_03300 [Cytophagales bacterium]
MKKGILISILVIALLAFLSFWFVFISDKSHGMRAGSIVKLSEKGLIFKTWEGQFFLGQGVVDHSENVTNVGNNIWEFSVAPNDTLIEKLNYYMGKGKRVTLEYHQKRVKLPWKGETEYIVVGVKEY